MCTLAQVCIMMFFRIVILEKQVYLIHLYKAPVCYSTTTNEHLKYCLWAALYVYIHILCMYIHERITHTHARTHTHTHTHTTLELGDIKKRMTIWHWFQISRYHNILIINFLHTSKHWNALSTPRALLKVFHKQNI